MQWLINSAYRQAIEFHYARHFKESSRPTLSASTISQALKGKTMRRALHQWLESSVLLALVCMMISISTLVCFPGPGDLPMLPVLGVATAGLLVGGLSTWPAIPVGLLAAFYLSPTVISLAQEISAI